MPRFAVVASGHLGWGSVRELYRRELGKDGDIAFFDPERFEPRLGVPWLKSLQVARGFARAARAAMDAGFDRILVTSFTAAMLLPQGPRYTLYGDATFRQLMRGKELPARKKAYESKVAGLARLGASFLCMSDWAQRGVLEDFRPAASHVSVLRNPVDTALFCPAQRPPEGRVVAFLGGDFLRKGGDLVLEAARRFPDVRFHLISPGAPEASDNVIIHRHLKPQTPELVRVLQQCHAMVLPTREDCSPNALAEALAVGLPVLTTNVGGCAEYTAGGTTGRVIEPSAESLCDALSDLFSSRENLASMSSSARDLACHDFDLCQHLSSLVRISSPAHSDGPSPSS